MNDPLKGKSYDSPTPIQGKDVSATSMLTPGAREPYATGKNDVDKRDKGKHKPFGKLGVKGFCES